MEFTPNFDILPKEAVLSATCLAAVAEVGDLTNDRVVALTGGHGMINIAVHTAANVIADAVLKGGSVNVTFANERSQPVDEIMAKAIDVAKRSGADGANAALIVACLMYLTGSRAQVGIPAGNRKLGATARMLAGVDRSGVAAVPTAKMNNKISAFPAVAAIYQAMVNGELTDVDGRNVPLNVAGGPLYGHSVLGEDVVWPQMARNGARIGTQAMLDAMAGAAMHPHPFTAAVLGAAAILEVIHPDAEVPEGEGDYGRTTSAVLVGRSACETAGLPPTVHFLLTGEEVDTAGLVGDLGLILKDIGGPSVIGMMAFDEIFSVFTEGVSGFSGGPVNPPLGHVAAYAVAALRALVTWEGDTRRIVGEVAKARTTVSFDPEVAATSLAIIARKAHELHAGPVTRILLDAATPLMGRAIYVRAERTYEQLRSGRTLAEIVKAFDDERIETAQTRASALFTAMTGQPITVKVRRLGPGARRTAKLARKYMSFDASTDVSVTVGEQHVDLDNFVDEVLPDIVIGKRADLAWAAPWAAAVLDELILAGCVIINAVVPAAVACVLGADPAEAGTVAQDSAYVTAGIPGIKARAARVGSLAAATAGVGS